MTAALAWSPAWVLSRLPGRTRNLILLAIIIPYLTSYLLLIYSIFVVLGPGSPVMALLRLLGLAAPGASILYTQAATVVMLVYENLPLMIFVLFSGMQRVDAGLLAAAGSLGAGRWRRMRYIVFPLASAGPGFGSHHGSSCRWAAPSWSPLSSAVRTACSSATSSPTR